MKTEVDGVALAVFVFFLLLVTVLGFIAARWRRPETLAHLDEWGLGGRKFGTWITWFLVGGDFYTAYTVIAVRWLPRTTSSRTSGEIARQAASASVGDSGSSSGHMRSIGPS